MSEMRNKDDNAKKTKANTSSSKDIYKKRKTNKDTNTKRNT